MSLVNLKTNLKSLRYGRDRIGGGDSGQPYIQTSIPANTPIIPNIGIFGGGTGGEDFLLRGGTLTPSRVAKDVSRLTKMFLDNKSPNGVLFAAKQNVLSRIGVKSQASGLLNEGIYTPLSTLLQAAGTPFGAHFNKQGLNPGRDTSPSERAIRSPWGLPVYAQTVKSTQKWEDNRLVQLQLTKVPRTPPTPLLFNDTTPTRGRLARRARRAERRSSPSASFARLTTPRNQISRDDQEILKYGGGPGSFLGIGSTIIRRYTNTQQGLIDPTNPDYNPRYYGQTPFFTLSSTPTDISQSPPIPTGVFWLNNPYQYTNTRQGLIDRINQNYDPKYYGITSFISATPTQTSISGSFSLRNPSQYTDTSSGLDFSKNPTFKDKYYTLSSQTLFLQSSSKDNIQLQDFRIGLLGSQVFSQSSKKNILAAAPSYRVKNIEQRVNLGDPGKRDKNVSSYTDGLLRPDGSKYGSLDKINAMPLYQSGKANHGGHRNDLVKFSIGIIDNDIPSKRTYIHFRAFLDSMDDNYNAEWNNFKYMGRGENFHRYNGFTRTINLGWTVAAQSKEELIPMYQKLNFLASSLSPDYSANGYMRGNLAVLTVGGYLFEQPGIINSINYSVPTDSPWEIGINNESNPGLFDSDHTVKEMPHIIKVTGFSFTPIQEFVPKLQKNQYDGFYGDTNGGINNVISSFGYERYIALSRSTDKDDATTNYNPPNDYTWGGPNTAARRANSQQLAQLNRRLRNSRNNSPLNTSLTAPANVPGVNLNRPSANNNINAILSNRTGPSNTLTVPSTVPGITNASGNIVASPNITRSANPAANANTAIEDIRKATQTRNLQF